jgi:predicted dehydrogenase/nucleoside-diphosphate-sugar epimerase
VSEGPTASGVGGVRSPSPVSKPRIAVVGCGAVARENLLPVLAGHDGLVLTTLVDRDEARARGLARAYSVGSVLTDLDGLTKDVVDAVVLATPPAHHAPATIALAGRGLHVFVEKPMATTASDAEAMVAAADRAGVALSVGLYRRMLPVVSFLRRLIDTEEYGAPLSVDIEQGGPYGWQLATLDGLTTAHGGGGVLIDIGSHVIDLLLYLLPATASVASYEDNSRGGIETDSVAAIDLSSPRWGRIPVRLELSRTRELRGSIRVVCERATLELLRGNFTQLLVHRAPQDSKAAPAAPAWITDRAPDSSYVGYEAFRAQFDTWLRAMTAGGDSEISGRSVMPVVRLVGECYQNRTALPEPWTDEGFTTPSVTASPAAPSKRRRVLVTGAGGFLGGRAVELLRHRYGWDVVPVVKAPKSAARLARWPGDIALGDVCSRGDMDRVLRDCDAVVHCAVGTSWDPAENRRVTVGGTATVAEAALGAGVKRFVHISSMFVHRRQGRDAIDETTPLEPPTNDGYGQAKLAAEREVERLFRRGLSTIILRPTRIYGPLSKTFTVKPLEALTKGRFAVGGDPHAPANMVYVDNVVAAIASALEAPATLSGQAYLVNDPEQTSLHAFFEAVAGVEVPIDTAPVLDGPPARKGFISSWAAGLRAIAFSAELRALVHRIMDTRPIGTFPAWLWGRSPAMQQRLLGWFHVDAAVIYRPAAARGDERMVHRGGPGLVSSAKAERDLGLTPLVTPSRAISLTRAWARSARLIT